MQENTNKLKNKLVIVSIIGLLGAMLFMHGFIMMIGIETAIPINKLSKANCNKGKYVFGYIDDYVIIENEYIGNTASMEEIAEGSKIYGVSLIRLKSDDYIQFLYNGVKYKKKFYRVGQEKAERIYIKGRITTDSAAVFDPELYEASISPEGYSEEKVIKKYVIKDINFEEPKYWMLVGTMVMVFGVVLCVFVIKETKVSYKNEYSIFDVQKCYDIENEIKVQGDYIEKFQNKLYNLSYKSRKSKKYLYFGIVLEIISFFDNIIWIGAIIGIASFAFAVGRIYEYSLNSEKGFFKKIMDRTGNVSIYAEIQNKKEFCRCLKERELEQNLMN